MGRQSLKERAVRSGHTPAKITAARTAAIEQMNSKLKRKFNRIEKSVNDLRAENLRYYYSIGKTCEEIRENPEEYVGHDGTSGLKLIEAALSTQARTLRKAAAFARTYDDKELAELIDLYHVETNFQLHWGHVSYLLSVPTAELRRKYAIWAVEKMLDPPALHTYIKKKQKRSTGHGRGHELPATVPAQIRQVHKTTKTWVDKNDEVWNGEADEDKNVFTNVMNMPPDEMDEELLDNLTEVQELMGTMSEAAHANVALVKRVKEHVKGCLKKREKAEAAEQASGKARRSIDLDGDGTGKRRRNRSRQRGAAA